MSLQNGSTEIGKLCSYKTHGLFTAEMIVAGAVNGNVSACVGQKVNSTTIIVAAFIDELSIGVDIVLHSIMSAIL